MARKRPSLSEAAPDEALRARAAAFSGGAAAAPTAPAAEPAKRGRGRPKREGAPLYQLGSRLPLYQLAALRAFVQHLRPAEKLEDVLARLLGAALPALFLELSPSRRPLAAEDARAGLAELLSRLDELDPTAATLERARLERLLDNPRTRPEV